MSKIVFPEKFYWGTATASYQIEGGAAQDGRKESIWDRFCQMPGNILNNDNGAEANDHYNRFREDVKLMKELGHTSYRFSVSWSRVIPDGTGAVNEKGLKFYSDLVDELLAAGIEPFLTIYHWDLPQALQDRGGWQNEESIAWFEEYCRVLFTALNGRVKYWATLNEPYCTAWLGNHTGEHAPGMRDLGTAIRVSYNELRAHGAAVRLFRSMGVEGKIGIVLNNTPVIPASDDPRDQMAARYQDGYNNRWFYDPVFKGTFPRDMIELFRARGITLPDFSDEASICEPLDFFGLNYYFPTTIAYDKFAWPFYAREVRTELPYTDRGWPIAPKVFRDLIIRLNTEYKLPPMVISENGASYNDVLGVDGQIHDANRIDFIRRHLEAVHEAIEYGVDVFGYFVWSLYDNFEWAFGRYSRFGIVYEDFDTHVRTPKDSAYWYRKVIEENGFDC